MTNREKLGAIQRLIAKTLAADNDRQYDEAHTRVAILEIDKMINGKATPRLEDIREVLIKLRDAAGSRSVRALLNNYMTDNGDLAEHLREVPVSSYSDLHHDAECDLIETEIFGSNPKTEKDAIDARRVRSLRTQIEDLDSKATAAAMGHGARGTIESFALGAEDILEAFDEIFASYLEAEKDD